MNITFLKRSDPYTLYIQATSVGGGERERDESGGEKKGGKRKDRESLSAQMCLFQIVNFYKRMSAGAYLSLLAMKR